MTHLDIEDLNVLAFEHAPIGIVLTEDRVIRSCNQEFARMFGYESAALIGRSFRILYGSQAEFDQIRDVGIAALQSTGKYSDERLMPRRDGSLFWCRVRVHSFSVQNPLERAILTFADISDVRPAIPLTVRERQVIEHLARGLTAKETGRVLSISPRTVEEHRARLLVKFDAKNATELLARLAGYAV